jgi:hypothetical protein
MKPEHKPVYMVFRIGGGSPSEMHATREEANEEAVRLCYKHPNNTFYVLEAVSAYSSVVKVESTDFKGQHPYNDWCVCNTCALNRVVQSQKDQLYK